MANVDRRGAACVAAAIAALFAAIWLSPWLPTHRFALPGARLWATASLFGWTAAAALLGRRLGRSPWLTLLFVPLGVPGVPPPAGAHDSALQLLSALPGRLIIDGGSSTTSLPALCLLALVTSWVLLINSADVVRPTALDHAVGAVFAVLAAAYFVLPTSMAVHALPPAGVCGVLLVRGTIAGGRRWLLAPAGVASLAYAASLALVLEW